MANFEINKKENMTIKLAVTAKWPTFPTRLDWIVDHGFALEYAPDPGNLDDFRSRIAPYLKAGLQVRYHAFLPGYELGHANLELADRGLGMHKRVLEAIHGNGEPVITIHIGLDPKQPIDERRAVQNLKQLVEFGRSRGIIVCLENLRRGLTSDPAIVCEWAEKSGSAITFDLGHAVSSDHVKAGRLSPEDHIRMFAGRLYELHLYGSESDRHYPPQNLAEIQGYLDLVAKTDCEWWTIELDDYDEICFTKQLVTGYVEEGPR